MWEYEDFSDNFLKRHHPLVLLAIMSKIKAFFLYPPKDCCRQGYKCSCEESRKKVILSLNFSLYQQEKKRIEDSTGDRDSLPGISHLLGIPDIDILSQLLHQGFSPGFTHEKLKEQEADFKRVASLVWALLRLDITYKNSYLREPKSTIKEALSLLLGEMPLKRRTKAGLISYTERLGGEKAYERSFKMFRPLCHLITALELMKGRYKENFSWSKVEYCEPFLKLAHFLYRKLLSLQTPNVKRIQMG